MAKKVSLEARIKEVFEQSNGNIIVVHEFLRDEGYSYRKDYLEGLIAGISLHSENNGKFTEKDFERSIRVTEEEKQRIIELYEECNGYASKASKKLENEGNYRTYTTIIKIWREQGLKIHPKGGSKVTEEEKQRIIKLYEECDGYAMRAEEILENEGNYRPNITIIKIWREEGLKIHSKGGSRSTKQCFLKER